MLKRTAPPALRKETPPYSSYEDTDDEDDEDGEDVAGRTMAEKPIAAVEERLDDNDSDDDCTGEESDEVNSDSREQEATPPHNKKQRRLYQDAVENEEDNNRAEWSAAETHRTSTSVGCSATSPSCGRRLLQWKRSFWNMPVIMLVIASEEVQQTMRRQPLET